MAEKACTPNMPRDKTCSPLPIWRSQTGQGCRGLTPMNILEAIFPWPEINQMIDNINQWYNVRLHYNKWPQYIVMGSLTLIPAKSIPAFMTMINKSVISCHAWLSIIGPQGILPRSMHLIPRPETPERWWEEIDLFITFTLCLNTLSENVLKKYIS